MLTINDLKNKMIVTIENAPYQILEVKHLHMGRGGSSVQTRIRNLATGQVFSRNFKPSDAFGEAAVEKRELSYLYAHRGEYVFTAPRKPGERYALDGEQIGDSARWLKPGTQITALFLDGKLLSITPPVKIDYRVTEAPPGLKGDTVSGATKTVTIETGTKVQTPLFVEAGDVIRVNTETGEYAERVTKA
ncbi:MAG: hypothetical protein A3B37_00105 [Candidatus Sungbacteria bacterium RIFCSPLOWO2_01_FULL_59_16]|uniref:Elongation factor P n=1 Tax=Candidatus Sungbacteria bacterium RIFCSPLOWO2_01_FULL_59_16 TaxID=1802280 RepID=A0A1G2LCI0_9BACT|nr:MAG: hypothetical protein A3B37_00105 [Candidatus Sungbacteria bacterium RIFCSPLOWO2_01_FULL_59_16]